MKKRSLLMLSISLLLAGCGGAEGQLRTGLERAGLAPSLAACMAKPMAKDLSLGQLMKLRSLGKVSKLDPGRTSTDKLLHHLRALGDPEIVSVTSAAAIGCALG
jgi:hypothetical protein